MILYQEEVEFLMKFIQWNSKDNNNKLLRIFQIIKLKILKLKVLDKLKNYFINLEIFTEIC